LEKIALLGSKIVEKNEKNPINKNANRIRGIKFEPCGTPHSHYLNWCLKK
jgi:hypothetical protein